jgi:acylglycerol lipase
LRFGISISLLIGGDGLQKYVTNSRGMEIFVKSWMPEEGRPKGILFLCHGYGDTVTFFFEGKCSSMYCIGFYI